MIKQLEIKNYRTLKNLKLADLGRINLITGKNNTGKSSLLEALSLCINGGNPEYLKHLLATRDEFKHIKGLNKYQGNFEMLSSLFNKRIVDFDERSMIVIKPDKENITNRNGMFLTLNLVKYIEEEIIDRRENARRSIVGKIKHAVYDKSISNNEIAGAGLHIVNPEIEIIIPLNSEIFTSTHFQNFISRGLFISSRNNGSEMYSTLWDNIVLTKDEDIIISSLKMIDERIDKLTFIGEGNYVSPRIPVVKLLGEKNLHPLKALGDGVIKIFHIVLALVNCKDGYLLIDEFENGLHYSTQEDLWKVIAGVAENLDVQVFATTHSSDTITSLARSLKNSEVSGNVYRLFDRNGVMQSVRFSGDELNIAAEEEINLR